MAQEGVKKVNETIMKDGRTIILTSSTDATSLFSQMPLGTLYIDPVTKNVKVKIDNKWDRFSPSDIFDDESIDDTMITPGTLTGDKFVKKTITGSLIGDKTLGETNYGDESVGIPALKKLSVITEKIDNKAVTDIKLDDGCIEQRHFSKSCIPETAFEDNSILSREIGDGILVQRHFGSKCLPGTAFQDGSIQNSFFVDKTIQGSKIADYTLQTSNYALNSVNSDVIAENGIMENNIQDGQISHRCLASACIDKTNIASNAVTNDSVLDGTLMESKFSQPIQSKLDSAVYMINGNSGRYAGIDGSLNVSGDEDVKGVISCRKVINAVYMDIAEGFKSKQDIQPGDVVEVCEDGEVKKAPVLSKKVIGVCSDCYAECFGASKKEIEDGQKVPIGILGRIPVNVYGRAKTGDLLVSGGYGSAVVDNEARPGTIIGKVIEPKVEKEMKRILCMVYLA